MTKLHSVSAAALLVAVGVADAAIPSGYAPTQVQASSTGLNLASGSSLTIGGSPVINNNRAVAFTFADPNGDQALWFGGNGSGGQVGSATTGTQSRPSINAAGTVAITRSSSPAGVITYTAPGALTSVPGTLVTGYSAPVILNNGRVGVKFGTGTPTANSFRLVGGGQPAVILLSDANAGGTYTTLFNAAFNNANQYAATIGETGTSVSVVRRATYDPSTGAETAFTDIARVGTVVGTRTLTTLVNNNVSINDSGQVLFQGNYSGGTGLFLSDGSSITPFALTGAGGNFTSLASFPAVLNNNGLAAFRGVRPGVTGDAIWVTDGSDYIRAIGVGDAVSFVLNGSTVNSTIASFANSHWLNDNGDVVFNAALANGTRIIGVVNVPAPGAAALAGLAGLFAARRRR